MPSPWDALDLWVTQAGPSELSFQPRDWYMNGHVTQTRPICMYPETNSRTLEKTDLSWSIGLSVPILHLSLGPHPFPCNFAVLPLDFRLGHVAFGQWDLSKHDTYRGLKYLSSRLAHWYLFVTWEEFLQAASAPPSKTQEGAHVEQSWASG